MRFLTSRFFWLVAVVLASFWLLAAILSFPVLIEILNAMVVTVGVALIYAYARSAILSAKQSRRIGARDLLYLGIVLTWIANLTSRLWLMIWRVNGEPHWMLWHVFWAWVLWVSIVGGAMHLLAPGADHNRVPRTNWIILGLVVGTALALGTVILFWQFGEGFWHLYPLRSADLSCTVTGR